MTRFENKLCPVCRRPFTENDDIVVCPVCGTPHHRACYNEKGGCGVEEWHASGFVWEGHLPGEEPEPSNGQEEQSGVDFSKHDDTEGSPEITATTARSTPAEFRTAASTPAARTVSR